MVIVEYVLIPFLILVALGFVLAYVRERRKTATLREALSAATVENMSLQEKVMEITSDLPARRELERDIASLKRQVDQLSHLRRLGMVCRSILQREDDHAAGTRKVGSGLEKDLVDQIRKAVEEADHEAKFVAG